VDAVYRVLRRQFERMLWNEPGTRLGLDPEHLHDMRVATRRMRAALRVFRKALPPRRVAGLRRDLKWIGGALGAVRDLDVYIMHLQDMIRRISPPLQPAMEPYLKRLRSRRERARRSMLATLQSRRYAAFVARLSRYLDAGSPAGPSAPGAGEIVTTEARRVILKSLKRVLNDGRAIKKDSADSQLHRLRIRCKRLRYACEFFSDVYGRGASAFAQRVTRIQDLLGDHQDAVVARSMLSEAIAHGPAPRRKARELYAGIGELMALHTQRAARDRRAFAKTWQRFDRKKVRKPLEQRLDKLRGRSSEGTARAQRTRRRPPADAGP
jgi:CHAD domain-containing protein